MKKYKAVLRSSALDKRAGVLLQTKLVGQMDGSKVGVLVVGRSLMSFAHSPRIVHRPESGLELSQDRFWLRWAAGGA